MIQNTLDTVLYATIIWMGTGQIYHPIDFSLTYPFNKINHKVDKPDLIEYYNFYGEKVYYDSIFIKSADSAWNQIDSLEITRLFADQDYKVGIYLYPPTVGMFNPYVAKWIVFLYFNDLSSSVPEASLNSPNFPFMLYPNPCQNYFNITSQIPTSASCVWELLDLRGKSLMKGKFLTETKKVNVGSLLPGTYILRICDEENTYTTQFLKN
jgi:hypothetical protein